MVRSRLFVSLYLILLIAGTAMAGNESTGTVSAAFLKLGNGVRGASMGDAFVAVADDATGSYWNPAGMVQLERPELAATYNAWLIDSRYSTMQYVIPTEMASIGFSIFYLDYGSFQETTASDRLGTGNMITPNASVINISWAKKVIGDLSLGANVKTVQENIDSYRESGMALDVGALWQFNEMGLKVGMVMQNMGAMSGSGLPQTLKLGVSKKLFDRLNIAADLNLPNDNSANLCLGGEFAVNDLLTFRGGYNSKNEEGAGGNWGIGLGLRLASLNVDYAYVPYEDLGLAHRVGLRLGF